MAAAKNKQVIRKEINNYINLLRQKIRVLKAYLFGSYVRGEADRWSDIALAIVTDAFIGDGIDFKFLLTRLARRIDADIEPHPYLVSEFDDHHPMYQEIIRYGEQVA